MMEVFLARQSIFDRERVVFGYELLFRSGQENFFDHPDPTQATAATLINSFLGTVMKPITGGKRAFFNVSKEFLLRGYIHLFPPDVTAVEIQENIDPDPEVISACRKLKQAGYVLALDNFVYADKLQPLLELADIIKVDFLASTTDERRSLVKRFQSRGIKFLAARITNEAAFYLAKEFGYDYFQGNFCSKPILVKGREIPGLKLNYLQILQEIHKPDLNLDNLEQVIKRDVSLSYKILRYLNSPFFGCRNEIRSIKHALALLGEKDLKKWASLITLGSMGEDKPSDLLVRSIARARMCETLAPKAGMESRTQELFILGMFSLLDAIMDRPMQEILINMPLAQDIKGALQGEVNRFRALLETVVSYEWGEWESFSYWAAGLGISESQIPELYLQSIEWADKSLSVCSSRQQAE